MTKSELRVYQEECVETIISKFNEFDRQLIQLPTGSGKTRIFLEYLSRVEGLGLIICPTVDLVMQVGKNAKEILPNVLVKEKLTKIKGFQYLVLTAASLTKEKFLNELFKFKFDHIVIDEAHRSHSDTYLKFLDEYSKVNPNFKLLGVTATPERMDEKPLLEIFHNFTFSISIIEMIKKGYLCDVIGHRIKTEYKLKGSGSKSDFKLCEIKKLDDLSRNELILKTYQENCKGKKTLIFCLSIEHAEKCAYMLKDFGEQCEAIHGYIHHAKRKEILERFKSGETQVLTNCQLLTEGFDEPSIEAIIMCRPTKSKSLYCQMLGRGMRTYHGKDFLYLYELTDNAHNICTFNVAAHEKDDRNYEYTKGVKLTELNEKIDKLSLNEFNIFKEEYSVFELEDIFDSIAGDYLLDQLKNRNIYFFGDVRVVEARFLLWKDDLRRKYGFNQ